MKNNNESLICWPLIIIIAILSTISCIAVKCAAPYVTTIPNPGSLWLKQVLYYGLGAIIIFCILKFKNDRLYSSMWIIYGILMVFLVGLVIERFSVYHFGASIVPFAHETNGATSWYNFPGFSFQPSEFMKIALIICMSQIISDHNSTYTVHDFESDMRLIGKVLAVALPPMILVYLQNDAGVTLIMLASIIFILFVAGINHKWYAIGAGALIIGITILVYLFIYQHDIFTHIFTGHKLDRIYGWLDPEGTYQDQGYQLYNAMMAYGTAGWFGHGFKSIIISLQEPQTDFIFAIITLGFGFVGGIVTLVAILALDVIILRIGLQTKNNKDRYFIAGVFGCLIFQQFWNIGMLLGLLPITGITLPFISYGGSSLLSYMIAMGICFDIYRQSRIENRKNRYY